MNRMLAGTIIQNSGSLRSPVNINDPVNSNVSTAGTEVIIKMPAKYD
jgi:hypothetical protein